MLDPTPAVAFLNELGRPPWTLIAWKIRNGKWLDTKICHTNQEASAFVSKHHEHMIRFLLGYSRNPVTKVPKLGDLIMSFGVAMAVPINKLPSLGVCPPTAWIEGRDHGIALWRYLIPMNANMAWLALKTFATRFSAENGYCRVEELPLMIPLPYVIFP